MEHAWKCTLLELCYPCIAFLGQHVPCVNLAIALAAACVVWKASVLLLWLQLLAMRTLRLAAGQSSDVQQDETTALTEVIGVLADDPCCQWRPGYRMSTNP